MLYLDAAQDRLDAADRFASMVESVRLGTIFAHDNRIYRSWRSSQPQAARREPGLTGAALLTHVMGLRMQRPDLVGVV